MESLNTVFRNLISPLTREEYFESYFERKPYYSKHSDLQLNFNIEKFENLMWSHENELEKRIHLNKSGKDLYYKRKESGKDIFRWAIDQFSKGYTIIFNGIDEIDKEAANIARSIDTVFGGRTTINAFLTPSNSKGFLPHFDTHDVFVYQVSGKKQWNLYDQSIELPLDKQMILIDQKTLGDPNKTYALETGNLLYIPRGVIHGAYADDNYSLHLTIGIRPFLRVDYLKTMLDALSEDDPEFRKSHNLTEVSDYFNLIDKLKKSIEHPYFIKTTNIRKNIDLVSRSRTIPGHHLKNILSINELSIDSRLIKANPGKGVIADWEGKIRFYFPGIGLSGDSDMHHGYLQFDAIAYGAINFINNTETEFLVKEMPEIYDDNTKTLIAEVLLKEGFLKYFGEDYTNCLSK